MMEIWRAIPGFDGYEWARKIGCSRSLIGKVRNRQIWAWLDQ